MSKEEEKELDVFASDEEEELVEDDGIEVVSEKPDVEEGITAERDPQSILPSLDAIQKQQAVDVTKMSLDRQVTALGRKAGEELDKMPKIKVMVPIDQLSPDDVTVTLQTMGWITHFKRGVPVLLPDPLIKRLVQGGYNPTLVP